MGKEDNVVKGFLRSRAMVTWVILVILAVASPILGIEGGSGSLVVAIVLTLAVVKVRLVGLDFMELRHAPAAMRLGFEAYCLVLWAVLNGCFLLL